MAIAIVVTAYLASLLTLFSGFGLGTLLMPVIAVFFPVAIAIAMTAFVHLLNNVFKLLTLWRDIHWHICILFGFPALLAAIPGAWILTNFGSKVPIDYIYQMMGHARADVFIKAKARTIREERIREYIDFVTRDVLPEINDAEEGTHNIMWLNFESPKMNNLLLEYVNIKGQL